MGSERGTMTCPETSPRTLSTPPRCHRRGFPPSGLLVLLWWEWGGWAGPLLPAPHRLSQLLQPQHASVIWGLGNPPGLGSVLNLCFQPELPSLGFRAPLLGTPGHHFRLSPPEEVLSQPDCCQGHPGGGAWPLGFGTKDPSPTGASGGTPRFLTPLYSPPPTLGRRQSISLGSRHGRDQGGGIQLPGGPLPLFCD